MKHLNWLRATFVAGATLFAATVAQAAPITSNPTFVQNGLTFGNFDIAVTWQGTATPTSAAPIDVDTLGNGATGLQFSSGWTALGAGFNFSDARIDYTVSGTAGLSTVGLSFNGTFLGLAISSVEETIYSNAARTNEIGRAYVSCSAFGCNRTVTVNLSNSTFDTLYITKDINVTALAGAAQISVVTQSFNPVPVPEPMSMALFGTGLLGLALVRRKSQS